MGTFDVIWRHQELKSNSEQTFEEGAVAYQIVGVYKPHVDTDEALKLQPLEAGRYRRLTWDGTSDERGDLMDFETLRCTDFDIKPPKPRPNVVTEVT